MKNAMMRWCMLVVLACAMFGCTEQRSEDALHFSLETLRDDAVVTTTEQDFEGKFLLIAVGFTGCPDVCPETLLHMKGMLRNLDDLPNITDQIQPLFITINPDGDTVQDIAQYASYFDPRIIGVRAKNYEVLDTIVEQLGASYGYIFDGNPVVPPNLPKGYTVMHSSFIYLYSPQGELLDAFPYKISGRQLSDEVAAYVRAGADQ